MLVEGILYVGHAGAALLNFRTPTVCAAQGQMCQEGRERLRSGEPAALLPQ